MKYILSLLLLSVILIADEWKVDNLKGIYNYKIENDKGASFEITCDKTHASVSLKGPYGKSSNATYALTTIENKRIEFIAPINAKNKDNAEKWVNIIKYLETANNFYIASSVGGFYFKPTNSKEKLDGLLKVCTQFKSSNSKNNLTKNDTKSLSKPENPFSVEWKENQYNRLNLQIDIHSLTDITVNNVIVNNGKCETDIWNPAGAHKGELKGKFPKYLEQYDVLEILVWNCKKMHKIEIETNYGSYFYNIK